MPGAAVLPGVCGLRRAFVATQTRRRTHAAHPATCNLQRASDLRCALSFRPGADVWAFGVLLWSMLSGDTMPYGQASVQQILRGVASGTVSRVAFHVIGLH